MSNIQRDNQCFFILQIYLNRKHEYHGIPCNHTHTKRAPILITIQKTTVNKCRLWEKITKEYNCHKLIIFPALVVENGHDGRRQEKLLLSGDQGDGGKVLQDVGGHWEGECTMKRRVGVPLLSVSSLLVSPAPWTGCQNRNVSCRHSNWRAQMSRELVKWVYRVCKETWKSRGILKWLFPGLEKSLKKFVQTRKFTNFFGGQFFTPLTEIQRCLKRNGRHFLKLVK